MNSPFYPVRFKVWLFRVPCFVAVLPNDKPDPHFPSPSSGHWWHEIIFDGGGRADLKGLNRVVASGSDSSPVCTFCSLMSPPSILDISQERIGSWCSHLGVQKIDML